MHLPQSTHTVSATSLQSRRICDESPIVIKAAQPIRGNISING